MSEITPIDEQREARRSKRIHDYLTQRMDALERDRFEAEMILDAELQSDVLAAQALRAAVVADAEKPANAAVKDSDGPKTVSLTSALGIAASAAVAAVLLTLAITNQANSEAIVVFDPVLAGQVMRSTSETDPTVVELDADGSAAVAIALGRQCSSVREVSLTRLGGETEILWRGARTTDSVLVRAPMERGAQYQISVGLEGCAARTATLLTR